MPSGFHEISIFIQQWGYPAIFILMALEGPTATLTGAFLASLGVFNVIAIFFLSILADLLGDSILYGIGYFGGKKALLKAEKILRIKSSLVEKIDRQFKTKGARIIFWVKASTGLIYITFILAGTVRMNFKKFFFYSFLGGLVWSFFLVLIGYFFGYAAGQISQYIQYAGIAVFFLAIAFLIGLNLYKKKQSDNILKNKNGK